MSVAWSSCELSSNLHPIQRPEILSTRSNEILTAVVQGARKEETNTEVNLAAMRALYNSLEFVRENFEREVPPFFAGFLSIIDKPAF